jgi:hypothetical protein
LAAFSIEDDASFDPVFIHPDIGLARKMIAATLFEEKNHQNRLLFV